MNLATSKIKTHSTRVNFWRRFFAIWLILGMAFAGQAVTKTPVARPETNNLTLSVIAARTDGGWLKGETIPTYKYLINVDNTGNPTQARDLGCSPLNPGYPSMAHWKQ